MTSGFYAPLALQVKITKRGRDLYDLNANMALALEKALGKSLDMLRKNLLAEAPSGHYTAENPKPYTSNPYFGVKNVAADRLKGYFGSPGKCVRRYRGQGLFMDGMIIFNPKYIPHLPYVIDTVKPHFIYPNRKNILKFYWAKENRLYYGTQVYHKTKKANNFIERAYLKSYPHINGNYWEELIKVTSVYL